MLQQIKDERTKDQLRNKISSKITVSTFLAGFNFTALWFVLSILSDKKKPFLNESHTIFDLLTITNSLIIELIAVMFFISAAFFVASVYSYDRLLMPRRFWQGQSKSLLGRFGERILDFVMKGNYQQVGLVEIMISPLQWEFITDLKLKKMSENILLVLKSCCYTTISKQANIITGTQNHSLQTWQIRDKKKSISIDRRTRKQPRDIYTNFTTEIQDDLNKGIVSGDLLNFIKNNGIPFYGTHNVELKEKDKRWLITEIENKFEYLLEKINDDLHFYEYELRAHIPLEKIASVKNNDILSIYFLMLFTWFIMFIPATISSTIGILLMLIILPKKISVFVFVGIFLLIFLYYQALKPRLGTD